MPEFRVYLLTKCPINPPPEPASLEAATPLLGLIVPRLIETAIRGIANALKKAGANETDQVTAECFTNLYKANDEQALEVNRKLGCVLGVWFDDADNSADDDEVATKLKHLNLVPTNAAVGGVIEAAINLVSDSTAFFLTTRYFSVRDSIGDRRRSKTDRDYLVTLSLATPGPTAEGITFALGKINLGQRKGSASVIPSGQPLDASSQYKSNLMPWSQISVLSKEAYDRDVSAGRPQAGAICL